MSPPTLLSFSILFSQTPLSVSYPQNYEASVARALWPGQQRGDMTRAGRHAGPTMSVQSNCSSRGQSQEKEGIYHCFCATPSLPNLILNFSFDSLIAVKKWNIFQQLKFLGCLPSQLLCLIDWREDGSGISGLYHLWNWSSSMQEYHFSTFRLVVVKLSADK